jgi:hypothetical protein
MKFLQRLSKYLVGVMIGIGMTYVMFSDRGCMDWLPGKTIKKEIFRKNIKPIEEAECVLRCGGLNESDLIELVEEGSIRYKQSGPREFPRRYLIEGDGALKSATFLLTDTASTVIEVVLAVEKGCDC